MNSKRPKVTTQHSEQGYALIALVGILMFALILTTAAAPMIKRESQREKEEEMLWRGAQVAKAIELYGPLGGPSGKPLTKLRDLVEGREQPGAAGGTKIGKVRFLRPSALCDPMMPCKDGGPNWKSVYANDQIISEFRTALEAMISKLPLNSPERIQLAMALSRLPVTGQASGGGLSTPLSNDTDSDSDSSIGLKTRPIFGVISEKNGEMFRNYYGVEKYEKAPFLPGVPVLAGGIILPLSYSNNIGGGGGQNNRCPDGSYMIEGKCGYGVLKDGRCPPSKRGVDGNCLP